LSANTDDHNLNLLKIIVHLIKFMYNLLTTLSVASLIIKIPKLL